MELLTTTSAALLFIVFYLVGMIGIVVPILPGVPLAALGALLAGLLTGFETLTPTSLVIVAGLAVLAQAVDYLGSVLGSRYYGASQAGTWGGVIGSLVGLFFFPPFGFLLGALVGAVAFELIAEREFDDAVRSGVGALVGTLGGMFAKVIIVIAIGIVVFPRLF